MNQCSLGPPEKEKPRGSLTQGLHQMSQHTADASESTTAVRQNCSNSVLTFDARHARRVSEPTARLCAIDRALTATSLAAEIRDWLSDA